jgi:histidine ammonia-lyase
MERTMLEHSQVVEISGEKVTIEEIVALSQRKATIKLSDDGPFVSRIGEGYQFLENLLKDDGRIYGVTTGYGASVTREVSRKQAHELPHNLVRFHGCGMGRHFDIETSRAVVAARVISLSKGFSGVRYELLNKLTTLLKHDVIPQIPEEGSVGASGDLTPLSYVAATLIGERKVHYKGEVRSTQEVFNELNIEALTLQPKEGLAIMNGTAVMTAVACLAFKRAEYLMKLATRSTSLVSLALKGNKDHFDEYLFSAKPHKGQQQIAAAIRADLVKNSDDEVDMLQDRYSVRCAPHIIGVLADALPHFREIIENELNSANDNPLIDPSRKKLLHGGHFYGGHIAYVMDSMKTLVANLADLLDRQLAMLVDVKFNNGLTSNLSMPEEGRASLNHGFKAVQIGVSSWTAEALKGCMPASVFSRSTECHNQDKVSMGTIAARDCIRVLELTEQVQAAMLLATSQAIVVREKVDKKRVVMGQDAATFVDSVLSDFELVSEDRELEGDLRRYVSYIREQKWQMQD